MKLSLSFVHPGTMSFETLKGVFEGCPWVSAQLGCMSTVVGLPAEVHDLGARQPYRGLLGQGARLAHTSVIAGLLIEVHDLGVRQPWRAILGRGAELGHTSAIAGLLAEL
ncbi:hypothetical protein BHE74_00032286 [Ensete ventricosum]|nr:hypothetical protein BHE74_00032286 [Ensete ventricosum]